MKINKVIMIKNAEETTQNALYQVEYTVTNGTLDRILATIMDKESLNYIGSISLENENVSCTIPYVENVPVYFDDFNRIVELIKTEEEK